MPYVKIKAYPKDEATKKALVEKINRVFLETWGCSQEALSISLEEVAPEHWDQAVRQRDILPNKDKMMILDGKKCYE